MSKSTDCELMARYAAGDVRAFDELFERYEGRAHAYFIKRTGSEDRAQDLYQELFLRLHRFRDRYDPSRPFRPWFYRVAQRVLFDEYRKRASAREVDIESRSLSAPGPRPDDLVDERWRAERALEGLSPEQVQILLASKVEGRAYSEIAREIGKSADAVKQAASRAVRRLKLAGAALGC